MMPQALTRTHKTKKVIKRRRPRPELGGAFSGILLFVSPLLSLRPMLTRWPPGCQWPANALLQPEAEEAAMDGRDGEREDGGEKGGNFRGSSCIMHVSK